MGFSDMVPLIHAYIPEHQTRYSMFNTRVVVLFCSENICVETHPLLNFNNPTCHVIPPSMCKE